MARPAAFDVERARDRALLLFWQKGFQAASLPELLAAMAISRSSFYAAYGDKRRLFVECLDLFAERTRRILSNARADRPPLTALQFFFERHLDGAGRARASYGCLLVNTVLEMAGVDDDLSDRASRHLAAVERLFETTLRDAGFAPASARELAGVLMLLNEGLRVASRRRAGPRSQLDSVAATFRMLREQLA